MKGQEAWKHLSPDDRVVWAYFVGWAKGHFDRIDYDVTVGQGAFEWSGPEVTPPYAWLAVAAKRIDVVGWQAGQPTIIEVKPVGGMSALGQLLVYGSLWAEEKRTRAAPLLMCACERADVEVARVGRAYGVWFHSSPGPLAVP